MGLEYSCSPRSSTRRWPGPTWTTWTFLKRVHTSLITIDTRGAQNMDSYVFNQVKSAFLQLMLIFPSFNSRVSFSVLKLTYQILSILKTGDETPWIPFVRLYYTMNLCLF